MAFPRSPVHQDVLVTAASDIIPISHINCARISSRKCIGFAGNRRIHLCRRSECHGSRIICRGRGRRVPRRSIPKPPSSRSRARPVDDCDSSGNGGERKLACNCLRPAPRGIKRIYHYSGISNLAKLLRNVGSRQDQRCSDYGNGCCCCARAIAFRIRAWGLRLIPRSVGLIAISASGFGANGLLVS